jgi:hypothetical protein
MRASAIVSMDDHGRLTIDYGRNNGHSALLGSNGLITRSAMQTTAETTMSCTLHDKR